ncbi:hypothetical protein MesoLj113b_69120 (plasmid) [Mesorhizobium sp. 113-3-3]|nr:hypothetical protein MesoLj113b_69120 [Mesorhizobium sp. 113-3-3]
MSRATANRATEILTGHREAIAAERVRGRALEASLKGLERSGNSPALSSHSRLWRRSAPPPRNCSLLCAAACLKGI